MELKENMVIQFIETHKWCGAFAFVNEIKDIVDENGNPTQRIMAGVPMLGNKDGQDCVTGTAYIFTTPDEFEVVGYAALIPNKE